MVGSKISMTTGVITIPTCLNGSPTSYRLGLPCLWNPTVHQTTRLSSPKRTKRCITAYWSSVSSMVRMEGLYSPASLELVRLYD